MDRRTLLIKTSNSFIFFFVNTSLYKLINSCVIYFLNLFNQHQSIFIINALQCKAGKYTILSPDLFVDYFIFFLYGSTCYLNDCSIVRKYGAIHLINNNNNNNIN
ncbi:hypothetical protein KQX54_008970 [Cotesia glomerata]|uniref:Uncharacterized protein n=1 Tax=Cotesia glomerata TaxID=32391 RepID=A0AAV7J1M8_COTGL|nr:hypothetical protein KQX54_008970 [Cotesia glomerata]